MSLLRPILGRAPPAGLSRSLHSSAVRRQAPAPQATMPLSQALARTEAPRTPDQWAAAYPRHPLLAFFHTTPVRLESSHPLHPSNAPNAPRNASKAAADVHFPAVLTKADLAKDRASRAWATPELRTKSSFELHQLWYLCLVERNVLDTSFEELRWTGVRALARMNQSSLSFRRRKLRKTMARIKFVLNERRIALEEARFRAMQSEESGAENPYEQALAADAPAGGMFEEPLPETPPRV